MPKTIRCALYDRVSTDSQVENGISLDTQRDALTEYAHKHGYQIVGYYSDEGITARKKMQNRKELLRLLDDVRHDKIDLILVTKLDRWFRNIKDYHNTQAILEARALYPDSSLADLYNELTMPPELRKAHKQNDRAVMDAYGFSVKGMTESKCVAELMKLYRQLTEK